MLCSEYMEKVSHREHLTWLAHLEEPSCEEWLLMRIAQRVQQVLAGKQVGQIKLQHQAIHSSEKEEYLQKRKMTPEQIEEQTAAIYKAERARRFPGATVIRKPRVD